MNQSENQGLKRTINATSLALNAMNITIGAGIFVVPATIAGILGNVSFGAYFMCAGLMILVVLCFADIGSRISRSGGSYAYVEEAFGPFAGYLINVLFWLGYCVVADAALANAMADMMGTIYPSMLLDGVRIPFFIIIYGFFAWVNIRGAKSGVILMTVNTIIKLMPLLLLGAIGIFKVSWNNFSVTEWPPLENYGEAALLLFFAFVGSEAALGNSGEIRNPTKSIPRGMIMGLMGVFIIYVMVQFVAQGMLGNTLALEIKAPLAETARLLIGDFGFYLMIGAAIFSIYSTLSGDVLATSRVVYAGGLSGIYPAFLGKVHSTYQTPMNAIILFSSAIAALACIGNFQQLALVASSAILIIYLAVILATIKLKLKHKTVSDGFNLPGGLLIPVAASLVVLWFLSHAKADELIAMGVFFAVSSVFYFVYSRRNLTSKKPGK